jgi:hypothetical protein
MHRKYGEIDVEVKLDLLADHIILTERYRHKTVPRNEEVLPLTQRESIQHVVDAGILIEHQVLLKIVLGGRYFLLQRVDGFHKPILQQILEDTGVDIFLG